MQPGFLEQFFPEVTESAGGGMSFSTASPTCAPLTCRVTADPLEWQSSVAIGLGACLMFRQVAVCRVMVV